MKTYNIAGKLIHAESNQPINGLRIEAWDKDILVNDFVGEATSNKEGNFKITSP